MERRPHDDLPEERLPDGGDETSRRDFLKGAAVGAGVVGTGAAGWIVLEDTDGNERFINAIPASEGYLLVDQEMCAGCTACMATCSLSHEGAVNLSLSRIQVVRNPLAPFPDDVSQEQCRQCTYPACVEACPTGALSADPETGNVRMIAEEKCIGCERCMEACPFTPHRTIWNPDTTSAQKCDLCAETPYWDEDGGPDGAQACVEICPMNALSFTRDIPSQVAEDGYKVDLKPEEYGPTVWVKGKMS